MEHLILAAVALVAAAVNGGLGYGFSSITVPVALLFHAGRVLNPALVLIELFINALALVANRGSLRAVWPRMRPMLAGAIPGVVAGSLVLAWANPANLKLFTFSALLPLILLQSAGLRRPVRNEGRAALHAGAVLGALYGSTTISGPPLALIFNNQGLSRGEFRAALSIFRIVESSCALAAYLALGLFTREALSVAGTLAPSAVVGVALGYLAVRRLDGETFRRICMGADALLVGFGLARSLIDRQLVAPALAWSGLLGVAVLEAAILAAYFANRGLRAGATR
jgi:uncharacterized membrane protein YfcA